MGENIFEICQYLKFKTNMGQTSGNSPDKEREIARQKRVFGGQFEICFENPIFVHFPIQEFHFSGKVEWLIKKI
jgi:hypothetical protein